MEDLDESLFDIMEKDISLEGEYFDKAVELLKGNEDTVIEGNKISGISFWDIVSPIQDLINHSNYDFAESGLMFDGIDFRSNDDNTINMWYCVRDYLDDQIECKQPDLNDIKLELKLMDKLKEVTTAIQQ